MWLASALSSRMAAQDFTQLLKVPKEFKSKTLEDAQVVEWNNSCQRALSSLDKDQNVDAQIVASVAQLTGQQDWLSPTTSRLAQGICQ